MATFKLNYGDYLFPEVNTRFMVTPFIIVAGHELTVAQAIRLNHLKKISKKGEYQSSAQGIRLFIMAEYNGTREVINTVLNFHQSGGGSLVHIKLYPDAIADVCAESNYFFAADNVSTVPSMKAARKIYNEGYLKLLETVTDESLQKGSLLCKTLTHNTRPNRFAR